MMRPPVGIGERQIARGPKGTIYVTALGSCLGVFLFDTETQIGGVIHCQLPISRRDPAAKAMPYRYVDLGLPMLLQEMFDLGCTRENLKIKLVGCSEMLEASGHFRIASRNLAVARRVLWKNKLMIDADDTGGDEGRQVTLNLYDGSLTIRRGDATYTL